MDEKIITRKDIIDYLSKVLPTMTEFESILLQEKSKENKEKIKKKARDFKAQFSKIETSLRIIKSYLTDNDLSIKDINVGLDKLKEISTSNIPSKINMTKDEFKKFVKLPKKTQGIIFWNELLKLRILWMIDVVNSVKLTESSIDYIIDLIINIYRRINVLNKIYTGDAFFEGEVIKKINILP